MLSELAIGDRILEVVGKTDPQVLPLDEVVQQLPDLLWSDVFHGSGSPKPVGPLAAYSGYLTSSYEHTPSVTSDDVEPSALRPDQTPKSSYLRLWTRDAACQPRHAVHPSS